MASKTKTKATKAAAEKKAAPKAKAAEKKAAPKAKAAEKKAAPKAAVPQAGDEIKAEAAPKPKTIGQRTQELILELEGTAGDATRRTGEILDTLYEEFPHCNSDEKCVAWYRSKMRREGLIERPKRLTNAERKRRRAEASERWREKKKAEREARKEQARLAREADAKGA